MRRKSFASACSSSIHRSCKIDWNRAPHSIEQRVWWVESDRFESNQIQFNRVDCERNGDYRSLLTRAAAGDGAPRAGDNGGRAFSRDMARVAQIAAPMSLLRGVWPQGSYPGTRAAAGSRRQGETANTSSFVWNELVRCIGGSRASARHHHYLQLPVSPSDSITQSNPPLLLLGHATNHRRFRGLHRHGDFGWSCLEEIEDIWIPYYTNFASFNNAQECCWILPEVV